MLESSVAMIEPWMSGLLVSVRKSFPLVLGDGRENVDRQLIGVRVVDDLIISDYHLANGTTGVEAIERNNAAFGASIPAILISGDTAPERLRDAKDRGYILLHKPVDPMQLRAVMHQLFRGDDDRRDAAKALKGAAL